MTYGRKFQAPEVNDALSKERRIGPRNTTYRRCYDCLAMVPNTCHTTRRDEELKLDG